MPMAGIAQNRQVGLTNFDNYWGQAAVVGERVTERSFVGEAENQRLQLRVITDCSEIRAFRR
jgi:hypothetical protein